MKFYNILSLILVVILFNTITSEKIGISDSSSSDCSTVDVISFIWDDSCLASNGGCDISKPQYWNVTNPSDYNLNLDVSDQSKQVLLFINSTFTPCKLQLTGNQTNTKLVLGSNIDIKEQSVFIQSQVVISSQYTFTFGMLILVSTDIVMTDSSQLISNQVSESLLSIKALPPTLSLDDASSLKLSNTAQITTTYLHSDGTITLNDQSTIQATNVVIESYFYLSPTATIDTQDATFTNISNGGTTFVILGSINATEGVTLQNSNLSFKNLVVPNLFIDQESILYIESGNIEIENLSLYGNLNVVDSTIQYVPNKLTTLNIKGVINLQGTTNATFGNVVFNNNLMTSPNNAQVCNTSITITHTVYFQTALNLKSIVNVQPQASLILTKNLELEDCINNQGTVELHALLVCYQKAFNNIGGDSQLSLLNNAQIYAYEFYNNGTISAINSAKLNGNLLSYGTISIYEDQYFTVTGYCDLYSPSVTLIQGITYNTSSAAFEVTNIIKLAGELYFNVSDPPQRGSYVYHLIRSQIYLESVFSTVIPDPSLEAYGLPLVYNKNSNGEVSELLISYVGLETSSEIAKSDEVKEEKKDKKRDIALGVILPLALVAAVFIIVIVLIKRRNKNLDLYQKINDFNNDNNNF